MKLTVADCEKKDHTLVIIFYTPSVFRLRFDPFSDKPLRRQHRIGVVICNGGRPRTVHGEQLHPYAIVKEKPCPAGHQGEGPCMSSAQHAASNACVHCVLRGRPAPKSCCACSLWWQQKPNASDSPDQVMRASGCTSSMHC